MARTHGRFGVLYIGATNGAAATNVANVDTWQLNAATDTVDVTALGDANKVYVAGLPDSSGSFSGFWDAAATTIFLTAARDGLSRKMYLYPAGSSANYWYGDILLDAGFTGGVSDAIKTTANWKAASAITPIGTI